MTDTHQFLRLLPKLKMNRLDHIAEVWAVNKPTKRGAAVSVEAFDAEGRIILQAFGRHNGGTDHRPVWNAIVENLAPTQVKEQA